MSFLYTRYVRQVEHIDQNKTDEEVAEEFLNAVCDESPKDWVYFSSEDALVSHLHHCFAQGRISRLLADEIMHRGSEEMTIAIEKIVKHNPDINGNCPTRRLGMCRFSPDGGLFWGSSN